MTYINFIVTFLLGLSLGACIMAIFYSNVCKKWEIRYEELLVEYLDIISMLLERFMKNKGNDDEDLRVERDKA